MVKVLTNTVVTEESTETLMSAGIYIPFNEKKDKYTLTDDASIGTESWTIVGQGASCQFGAAATESHYLFLQGMGFNIPPEAVINGIRLSLVRVSASGLCQDNVVSLIKGGVVVGDNKSVTSGAELNWPNINTGLYRMKGLNYGSDHDLWGTTWTASDINSSDFGVAVSASDSNPGFTPIAKINQDAIANEQSKITVYYSIYNLVSR